MRCWSTGKLMIVCVVAIAARGLPFQHPSPTQPFDLIRWNHGKYIFGADYYPEAWPESQWERDARMMQAAGINFVRLGEFAWVKMEPEEGRFDFSWLDHAISVLSAHGIHAVLGTPTASPPAWLYAKYPDIAAMDEEGIRFRFGSRRNYCLHNPHFLAATQAIVTAMAEHYKNNPAVLGFQIDNELGNPYCYDSYCLAAFQNWCRKKYQALGALNRTWGTVFWGHTYAAWSQVPLPWNTLFGAHNPSLELDYDRFFSESTADYLNFQARILRQIVPAKAITTNEMGLFDAIDYSRLNTALDFVAWDNYPMFDQNLSDYFGPALAHDLMRGTKTGQNFMVMEEEAGLPGWTTFWGHQAPPGLYRVWAYQAAAHGANGVCFFRWRTSTYGTEQYWEGILDQDSYRNRRYETIARMGQEVQRLAPLFESSRVASQVAILVSPLSRWAFHIQPLTPSFSYDRQLHCFYDAFRRRAMNVDVAFPEQSFDGYEILVAPSLFVVSPQLARKLTDFVSQGGVLMLSYRSGVKDSHNVFTSLTLPGSLASLAGVAIHDYDPAINEPQKITMQDGATYPATVWYDILTPRTARPIAAYRDQYYASQAAITLNHYGRGSVIYVGTESPSSTLYGRLIALAAERAGLALGPELPDGVEMATREAERSQIIFLLNYTGKVETVALGTPTRDALTSQFQPASVVIPPYDVRILTRRRADVLPPR